MKACRWNRGTAPLSLNLSSSTHSNGFSPGKKTSVFMDSMLDVKMFAQYKTIPLYCGTNMFKVQNWSNKWPISHITENDSYRDM